MTVSATTASQAGAAAAGAIAALPMAVFGMQSDALGVGIFGALLISLWMPTVSTRRRAFAAVTLSGVAAGYFSPLVATYVATHFESMRISAEALRLPLALLLGIVGPTLLPIALRIVQSRAESGGI
jgi:hypothetical protein